MGTRPRSQGRRIAVGLLAAAIAFAAAACGGGNEQASTSPASGGKPVDAFNKLVANARATDGKVAVPLNGVPDAAVAADEAAFQKEFGFPVKLVNVPGHPSLELPPKVLSAGLAGKGVVDMYPIGDLSYQTKVFAGGYFRKPDWDALYYKWPDMKNFRQMVEPNLQASVKGQVIHAADYAAVTNQAPYVILYNKRYVSPDSMKGATWQTMLDPKFKGRVAIDQKGGTLAYYGLAQGQSAMSSFIKKLQSNAVIPTPGGSVGVANAVSSGQAWIGLASYQEISVEASHGAPVDGVVPTLSSNDHRVAVNMDAAWMQNPGVNSTAMSELFWAWYVNEGVRINSKWGYARLDPQESKYFPVAGQLASRGITEKDYVTPHTLTQSNSFNQLIDKAGGQLTGTTGS